MQIVGGAASWFTRHHVSGLIGLGLGVYALLGNGINVRNSDVKIGGPAGALIGFILIGIGVWLVATP